MVVRKRKAYRAGMGTPFILIAYFGYFGGRAWEPDAPALIELFSVPPDDNFSVTVFSALVMFGLNRLIV